MQALVARCAALIALIVVVTSSSSAFSSLAGGTHRLILEAAYQAVVPYLARGVPFPSIEEIGRFEGITAYKTEKPSVVFREGEPAELRLATTGRGGRGPDATTDYSWHYYNPRTGDGLAPAKVADYFSVLADALGRGTKDPETPPAKAAAYLAHFLADLSITSTERRGTWMPWPRASTRARASRSRERPSSTPQWSVPSTSFGNRCSNLPAAANNGFPHWPRARGRC